MQANCFYIWNAKWNESSETQTAPTKAMKSSERTDNPFSSAHSKTKN